MNAGPGEGKLSVDPQGILAHLLADIAAYGERVLSAEQLVIRLLAESVENGATVDDVAAELSLSRTDAESLIAGESMLRRRFVATEPN